MDPRDEFVCPRSGGGRGGYGFHDVDRRQEEGFGRTSFGPAPHEVRGGRPEHSFHDIGRALGEHGGRGGYAGFEGFGGRSGRDIYANLDHGFGAQRNELFGGHGCTRNQGFGPGEQHLGPFCGYDAYGHRGHGFHGHRGGHKRRDYWHDWRTPANPSSEDSDDYCGEECRRKKIIKHMKQMYKCRQSMFDPNSHKTRCTLCWHRIRPLVDTEILDCGHIYHRLCLKELFDLTLKSEKEDVFCAQCKQQIDANLVNQLKTRFTDESTDPKTDRSEVVDDLKKFQL